MMQQRYNSDKDKKLKEFHKATKTGNSEEIKRLVEQEKIKGNDALKEFLNSMPYSEIEEPPEGNILHVLFSGFLDGKTRTSILDYFLSLRDNQGQLLIDLEKVYLLTGTALNAALKTQPEAIKNILSYIEKIIINIPEDKLKNHLIGSIKENIFFDFQLSPIYQAIDNEKLNVVKYFLDLKLKSGESVLSYDDLLLILNNLKKYLINSKTYNYLKKHAENIKPPDDLVQYENDNLIKKSKKNFISAFIKGLNILRLNQHTEDSLIKDFNEFSKNKTFENCVESEKCMTVIDEGTKFTYIVNIKNSQKNLYIYEGALLCSMLKVNLCVMDNDFENLVLITSDMQIFIYNFPVNKEFFLWQNDNQNRINLILNKNNYELVNDFEKPEKENIGMEIEEVMNVYNKNVCLSAPVYQKLNKKGLLGDIKLLEIGEKLPQKRKYESEISEESKKKLKDAISNTLIFFEEEVKKQKTAYLKIIKEFFLNVFSNFFDDRENVGFYSAFAEVLITVKHKKTYKKNFLSLVYNNISLYEKEDIKKLFPQFNVDSLLAEGTDEKASYEVAGRLLCWKLKINLHILEFDKKQYIKIDDNGNLISFTLINDGNFDSLSSEAEACIKENCDNCVYLAFYNKKYIPILSLPDLSLCQTSENKTQDYNTHPH